MRRTLYALAASVLLASVASAGSHDRRHAHAGYHLLKKDAPSSTDNATCACTTYYTTYYGEATLIQPAPLSTTSTSTTPPAAASTTSTTAPPPPPTTTSAAPPPPASSSAAAQASPAGNQLNAENGSSAPISASGSQWAMAYTPYSGSTGLCLDAGTVASQISSIASKGFTTLRLYSTDCEGLPMIVPAAKAAGMKLLLGIYISKTGISGAQSQVSDITTQFAGDYSDVELVIVGNEPLFNGFTDGASLAAFISSVKTTLAAAGYTGPVTTTDTVAEIQANAATLCPVIDVVAANIHPFFNPSTSAAQAGAFVASQLQLLEAACPGKTAYNLETGWPHAGDANGAAVPGAAEQQTAVAAIVASAGAKSVVFSFGDDLWKAAGDLDVEQYWGCSQLFG